MEYTTDSGETIDLTGSEIFYYLTADDKAELVNDILDENTALKKKVVSEYLKAPDDYEQILINELGFFDIGKYDIRIESLADLIKFEQHLKDFKK